MQAEPKEIDLIKVVETLWNHKFTLVNSVIATTILAIVISFLVTPKYESSALVANVSSDIGRGGKPPSGVGELASLAGISIGGGEANQTTIALATLKSDKLIREFIEKNALLPVLYADAWDAEQKKWKTEPPTLWHAVKFFSKEVSGISEDKTTGLITVTMEWTDAEISSAWTKGYIDLANSLLLHEFQASNRRKLAFLNAQIEKTQLSELRSHLFALIQEEIKNMMLAEGRKEFAFKVIDPSISPERPAWPRKSIFAILGALLGGLFGCALVFINVVSSKTKPNG